jgi:hypothetical protein
MMSRYSAIDRYRGHALCWSAILWHLYLIRRRRPQRERERESLWFTGVLKSLVVRGLRRFLFSFQYLYLPMQNSTPHDIRSFMWIQFVIICGAQPLILNWIIITGREWGRRFPCAQLLSVKSVLSVCTIYPFLAVSHNFISTRQVIISLLTFSLDLLNRVVSSCFHLIGGLNGSMYASYTGEEFSHYFSFLHGLWLVRQSCSSLHLTASVRVLCIPCDY